MKGGQGLIRELYSLLLAEKASTKTPDVGCIIPFHLKVFSPDLNYHLNIPFMF